MAQHGGKREGAGKPRGALASHTVEAQELKKQLIAEYVKRRAKIDKALLDQAEQGNIPAIKELYDRVFGKSVQPIVGDKDNPIAVEIVQYAKNNTAV
jgi:hypothetical protein